MLTGTVVTGGFSWLVYKPESIRVCSSLVVSEIAIRAFTKGGSSPRAHSIGRTILALGVLSRPECTSTESECSIMLTDIPLHAVVFVTYPGLQ